ncbi:hypothetical protein AR275_26890 [Stenotrophomonas maltophilia]|nr:hypothetical protein AR275_26890 [Stenotrophomonas maltophilia]
MPGLPTGDSKSSTTRSGVADGTIDIRNGDSSTLGDLQRGVTGLDNANGFAPIFDEKKVQERQELTQILGEIGFKAVGNLASKKSAQAKVDLEVARANGDVEAEADALRRISEWGESGRNKVLLHGLTGAAVAALSGGDIGGAAAGATGAALAKEAMTRFLTGQGMDPRSGEFNSLIELASAALGGVVGGSDGAGTALLGDQFNRQMHWDQYLEALDVCKANPAVRGCSTILEMSDNTKAVVISDSSDEVAYKVIANQNKETGETVSFTLTESDGTPRLIMQKDEYNDFVVSGLPPPLWGMAPGYALDLGSYFTHGLRGQAGQAFGDLSNIFTSGEYWRDMALALITSAAGAKGGALVKGGKAPPASVASSGEVAVSRGGLAYLDEPPFNPVGSVGSAQVWSSKARIKYVELPTQGRIRYVPPSGYSASNPLPRGPNNGYLDRFGNEWTKGPSRTQGQAFEWDVQLSRTGKAQLGWATRDGSHLNISLDGRITHK